MKTTFSLFHFSAQNTPQWAQIIGDISLTLSFISAVIIFTGTQLPAGVVMPHILTVISMWAITAGSVVKFASKFFGVTDANGNAVNPNPPAPTNSVTTQN